MTVSHVLVTSYNQQQVQVSSLQSLYYFLHRCHIMLQYTVMQWQI
jgi:hypothetical protein